jgi:exopolysaccharide biosynthesis protein
MKNLFLSLVAVLLVQPGFAQTDSLSFAKAEWKKEKLAKGVWLRTTSFNKSLFNSNQNISIIEVKPAKKNFFDLGYEVQKLRNTSDFGKESGSLAAINGTFFDVAKGGSVDYIRSDGQVINENRLEKNNKRARHQQAAVVFRNGAISIEKWDGTDTWEKNLTAEDVMLSGPLLIMDDSYQKIDSADFNKLRHPRSLVIVKDNGRVLLVTVDGRNENAAGMSMFELARISNWLGADDAINLDGGGSTTLWVAGQPGNGVVNYPTDNKKWDHEGERKVANVILLKLKP